MVATTIRLPNIRKFFIPDEGYIICEADLSGADAQTVAWEADDEDMKEAFRQGLKIHIKNARDIYPELTKDMTDEELKATDHAGGIYHDVKRAAHGTNYGGTAKTIAGIIKRPIKEIEEFQDRYFGLHPGVRTWHNRIEYQLQTTRVITNPFGYRIMYFDRIQDTFKKALAWIPQSVTAHVRTRGALQVAEQFPYLQHLMEVHDSVVFQIPKEYRSELPHIQEALNVTVPYDDPLVIPWGLTTSDKSWGDIE